MKEFDVGKVYGFVYYGYRIVKTTDKTITYELIQKPFTPYEKTLGTKTVKMREWGGKIKAFYGKRYETVTSEDVYMA